MNKKRLLLLLALLAVVAFIYLRPSQNESAETKETSAAVSGFLLGNAAYWGTVGLIGVGAASAPATIAGALFTFTGSYIVKHPDKIAEIDLNSSRIRQ